MRSHFTAAVRRSRNFMRSIGYLLVFVNIIFHEQRTSASPWTSTNQFWNVNFNPSHQPAEFYGKKPSDNFTYFASPVDWRSESIYQVITDRFSDGNPDNNAGEHFGFDGFDLRFVNTRHGGDFKGLMNKLHYIKSLGYSSVWVSPVFQNMENSYHGYAQIDFTLLDDRFGTLEEFRLFVQKAHSLGIRVIVDIVVNHMADLYYFDGYRGSPDTPFHMHGNEYRMYPHNDGRQYSDFVVNNFYDTDGKFGPVYDDRGQIVTDGGDGRGSFWYSDFHHNGDLRDYGYSNPYNNHLGKIYGLMDDLRTTHPRVTSKITAMTKALIASTDIDGIRVDTPMQVPLSFFQAWVPAIREHASRLGKSNFGVFGEFYCTRERGSTMTGRGMTKTFDSFGHVTGRKFIGDERHETMDGGIHYPLYFWFMDSVKNQQHNLNGLMTLLQQDKEDYDFYNPRANWEWQYRNLHFYNNHDQWRMSTAPVDGLKKTDMSSAIIAFWVGIPLFYYGDEQAFKTPGTALDGWAREDMMTSLAWRHPNDQCAGTSVNAATGDSFSQTSLAFLNVQKIMNIRRNYEALYKCDNVYERWHQENFHNGVYAYTRACGQDDKQFVLIMFNTWKDTLFVPANAMYSGWKSEVELWNVNGEYALSSDKMLPKERHQTNKIGKIASQISINGYEVKVFVRSDNYRPLNPSVQSISPSHDQVLDIAKVPADGVPFVIVFNVPMNKASLAKAVRVNGKKLPETEVLNCLSDDGLTLKLKIVRERYINGINTLTIGESATSTDGIRIHGAFRSRFRVGNPSENVLLNGCLNFKSQPLVNKAEWNEFPAILVDQKAESSSNDPSSATFGIKCMKNGGVRGQTGWRDQAFHYLESNEVTVNLKHKAFGATKFRVRLGLVPAATSFGGLNSNNQNKQGNHSIVRLEDRNLKTPVEKSENTKVDSNAQPILDALEGPWSDWEPFKEQTSHKLTAKWRVYDDFCNYRVGKVVDSHSVVSRFDTNLIIISVQYYARGSSAYIVNSSYKIR